MKNRSYAVIGSGALGGLYGGLLAKAGFDVHFLFRRDYQHVRQHGLKVESILGDFELSHVQAYDNVQEMPQCDVTILGLKTTQNHLLQELLPPVCGEHGHVLCLQNGLNVERDSATVVGGDRVLGGCCFLCSNKVGPGHIRHLDQGRIVFGDWGPMATEASVLARSIAEDLVTAGIDANTTDDLPQTRWRKLMWNIPFNGLSVVLDASTKQLIEDPSATNLAVDLIHETRAAAEACGVVIPEWMAEKTIEVTKEMVPYDSSMRLDFLAGRPMEIQAIFGNPIDEALQHGFSMRRVEVLRDQLTFLSNRIL